MLKLPCVVGRLGRGKSARGTMGREKRGSRLSTLPIVQRALTIYNHFYFHWNTQREPLHIVASFLKSNVKECEVAMKSTSLLSCFLVDIYGQKEVIAYF